MRWVELFGYAGALLTFTTFSMKTMLHLRLAGIAANLAFIIYGGFTHAHPVLILHLALLPLNLFRLRQLLAITREIRDASTSGLSMDWLRPYTRSRRVGRGETIFHRGDAAEDVLFVLSGRFRAVEADVQLGEGEIFGELGLISKGHRRTQTVVCEEDGLLLQLSYDEIRQLYFQHPKFGFFLLEVVAERLTRDAARAEKLVGSAA